MRRFLFQGIISYNELNLILKNQKLFFSAKYVIKLTSDIEKGLNSGEIKHRKHPGIRKMPPIILPSFLQEAVYRMVSNQHEKDILKRANSLCRTLASRRLPVERLELENKICKVALELDGEENMPEETKKKRILQLKKRLQADIGHWKEMDYSHSECLAYLAGRAAPNYASAFKILSEIKDRIPSFQPRTFFDFGSGIGSSVWAANSLWKDSIQEYFCVDSSSYMNDLSQSILTVENTEEMYIKNILYRQFLPASDRIKYDLVFCSFSLLDLPSATERLQVIDVLWRKTNDILVVIEYGSLAGFSSILDARDYILHIETNNNLHLKTTGAHIVSPCPHEFSCPFIQKYKNPCGTTVTYQTLFPRQRLKYKKDFITYIVMRKGSRPESDTNWPRVVKPVLKKSKHAYCRLCCPDGQLHDVVVTKSRFGRHVYRSVRSSSLGDLLPVSVEEAAQDVELPDDVFREDLIFENDDDEENKT